MLNKLSKANVKIVEKWKIWFAIPAAILLAGLLVIIFAGLNLGIDFTGGNIVEVNTGKMTSAQEQRVTQVVNEFLDDNDVENSSTIQFTGADEDAGFTFTFILKDNAELDQDIIISTDVETSLISRINTALEKDLDGNNVVLDSIDSSARKDLIINTVLSIIVAAALILLYIIIRFEFLSGITAVVALLHDILIVIAVTAIFQIKVNASFVAAIITIVGYSINNTIVIFDRIRENVKKYSFANKSVFEITNTAIMETLVRTLNTSITTMVTVILLVIIGVPEIREFSLPIIFGLIAGSYSSMFISTSLWALFTDRKVKKNGASKYLKQAKVDKKETV